MRKLLALSALAISVVGLLLVLSVSEGSVDAAGRPAAFEQVVLVDQAKPFHGGPPPHTATDADGSFRREMGGLRWIDQPGAIEYAINTAECTGDCATAATAVIAGFDVWEVSGLTFTQNQAAALNPCQVQSTVTWAAMDGPGGILATAAVCFNRMTKDIAGFVITFDSGDTWSDSGEAGMFDIQAVTAHEAGHAVGPGHVNAPKASALTMFFATGVQDLSPRTLGCGDRLALNALYGAGLDCEGLAGD